MRLILANHSSYPRVGDSSESQRLRRAWAQRETGELPDAGYQEVARDYIAEIIGEQADAGLDVVTDGQVHWYDLISHLAGKLDGTSIDGLIRFFDTNYLIRQPEIVGKLDGSFDLVGDYTYASVVSSKQLKPVVTGPYTLARHSILRTTEYLDVRSLTLAYADILADELHAFAQAGARLVQIEEPCLAAQPEDMKLVKQALDRALAPKGSLHVSLVTYFGDVTPVYRQLLDLPVDMLGFDLAYGPGLVDVIANEGADRPLALGIVDGRDTKLDPDTVAADVERITARLTADGVQEVHLQPSCGLEYLPRDRARRKLDRLVQIAKMVEGKA